MYFNNVSIIYYLVLGLIGLMVGKFVAWMNVAYANEEKISLRSFWKNRKQTYKMQYITMFIIAVLYIALLYVFGIGKTFNQNLNLIKFLVLVPMLVSAFIIDLKYRIIPNRLNMTIFELRNFIYIYIWN